MQVFMGFRPHQLKLCSEDIKGRIRLGVIEHEQQFIGHGRQFSFETTSRLARSRSRLDPFFVLLVLRGLVDSSEEGQTGVEMGLGQTGYGFHPPIVSYLDLHRFADSLALLEYSTSYSLIE